jgi:hypothetical protein
MTLKTIAKIVGVALVVSFVGIVKTGVEKFLQDVAAV